MGDLNFPEASAVPRPITEPADRMVIWELAGAVPTTEGLWALVIRSELLDPVSGSIPETCKFLEGVPEPSVGPEGAVPVPGVVVPGLGSLAGGFPAPGLIPEPGMGPGLGQKGLPVAGLIGLLPLVGR